MQRPKPACPIQRDRAPRHQRRLPPLLGRALTCLTLFGGAACDAPGDVRDAGLRFQRPGALLSTAAPQYSTVFSIARPDRVHVGLSICAGTLIAPTVLLTAAHCVTVEPGDGTFEIQDPAEFFIDNGETLDGLANELSATDVDVHPDYAPGTAFFDLAVVHLDRDATPRTGGRIARVAETLSGTRVGLPRGIDVVGYGGNRYPASHYDPADAPEVGARMHLPHEIEAFGCDVDDPICAWGNLALSYDNSPEAGFCGETGGGPVLAFRDAGGVPAPMPWQYRRDASPIPPGGSAVVAAVVSRVVSDGDPDDCTGTALATRVDTAIDFLRPWLPHDAAPRRLRDRG